MKNRIVSLLLCIVMLSASLLTLASCGGGGNDGGGGSGGGGGSQRPDAFVIMTESLDGLFNPFYSTTANDATIVAMTQIGMLTTGLAADGKTVIPAYGDGEAVVVKDYKEERKDDTTVYTFIIKNGIKFSDGHALTIEDVLFNMYVYLDKVYTGSSTMYSTDIVGLTNYRTQTYSSNTSDAEDDLAENAAIAAQTRIDELIEVYKTADTNSGESYEATEADMRATIAAWDVNDGYLEATGLSTVEEGRAQLLKDYELTLSLFRKELDRDYEGAKDAYTEEPYKSSPVKFDEIVSFMYAEGFVDVEYERDPITNKELKNKFKTVTKRYGNSVVDKASAIDYVYTNKVNNALIEILNYWGTASELRTQYAAKAMEIILDSRREEDGSLRVKNIEGIKSLGHTTSVETVTIGDKVYNVAHQHNSDGTPVNADEYDVLEITINGVDPKAIWNFAFSVAPQHYYAPSQTVDIVNNKFGVVFGSYEFMKNEIQSIRNIKIPMGAGAYKATNAQSSDNPGINDFFTNNVVYFKSNQHFLLGTPKIDKIRYQVVSASNAVDALTSGTVHYISPQYTKENINDLKSLAANGIKYLSTDQLGYGYIGINAGKVKDINLRKAIMCAMDTSLALSYYETGTADPIFWPMSTVSWAYPKNPDGSVNNDNGKEYPAPGFDRELAVESIQDYMQAAGVSEGDDALEITFTIAGANLTDHPTYTVFQKAAEILNECGWDIEVVSDTQALTKLSTGSLAVWAAAWGSTVDPDMYQVYHKNSTATSVLAWGYKEILANPGYYVEETYILGQLSEKIDEARETTDRDERTALYKECMGYILDLAIELPVYQRDVLYAYNSNVIDSASLPTTINPYTSPIDKIWEIEFKD
ncbi:MAG: hypothetical protein IJY69_03555 [Clostridia bacterium]|nr:hypothetical protein [Clostridia bacterium]